MCLKCHKGLSSEIVTKQLKDSLDNPQFEKWNETSISHLCLAYIGINGEEAKNYAKQLLDNYVSWKTQNLKCSDDSFFGNPSADKVNGMMLNSEKMIDYLSSKNIVTSEGIAHAFYEDEDMRKEITKIFAA